MQTCASCSSANPPESRFCGACGATLQAPSPERRKTVTLLFCDLSGSTAMGERLDAESVRELMFRYFHEVRFAIERHSGVVEKFVGDAVMAVFGIPVAHEDDAIRAVRAAAEMRGRLASLNEEFARRFGTRIALRIGVNTGEVVAGDAAARETFVSGDAVNVAARLEQAAGSDEILLGEKTYRLARGAVTVEPIEPLALKGKAEVIRAYRLLGLTRGGPIRPSRSDAPLVGRVAELELLARAFAEARAERRCRSVTILGQAGVGKSRLADEFVSSIGGDVTILSGRCLPYGDGTTYWAVGEFVRQAARIRDEDVPARAREKIVALLADVRDGELAAAILAQAIGLDQGSAATGEIAWAVRRLCETLARERPLVLLLDDLHWAERAFLELLEQLEELGRDASIVLFCLARPELLERRPAWPGTIVRLEPLAENEVGLLIERLLDEAVLEEAVHARVLEAAGGLPLFVEQLLAMLVEDGLVERAGDRWRSTGDLAQADIPPTIEALLTERLDRLGPEERNVLERGAIEGQVFHRGAVVALISDELRPHVPATLAQLVARELVRPALASFSDEAAFRFRHILIRDAAYRSMPKRSRAEFHERFALWLESNTLALAAAYEEVLGYHFAQAYQYLLELGPVDDGGRALGLRAGHLLASAGRRAFARGDTGAAVLLLGRMAELPSTNDTERVARLHDLSVALRDTGDFERAGQVNAQAVERADASGLPALAARGLLEGALLHTYTHPTGTDELVSAAEVAIPTFVEYGDDVGLAQALWLLALAHWNRCDVGAVENLLERALVHAQRADDKYWRDRIITLLGLASLTGPAVVETALGRCRRLGDEAGGDRSVNGLIAGCVANLEAMRGNFERARERAAYSRTILRELGRKVAAAGVEFYAASVELLADEPAEAERIARSALEVLEPIGERVNSSAIAALLAESLYRQDRYQDAQRYTDLSKETAWADDLFAQVGWRVTRAKLLARSGAADEGEALAREAVNLLAEADSLDLRAGAQLSLAETLLAQGRSEEARPVVHAALALYEAKGNFISARHARERLAVTSGRVV